MAAVSTALRFVAVYRSIMSLKCRARAAAFSSSACDPLRIEVDLGRCRYQIEVPRDGRRMSAPAASGRRTLLRGSGDGPVADRSLSGLYEKAYRLLDSETLKQAMDMYAGAAGGAGAVRLRRRRRLSVGEGGGGGNGAEMGYARQMRGLNLLAGAPTRRGRRAVRERLRLQAAGPELGRPFQGRRPAQDLSAAAGRPGDCRP